MLVELKKKVGIVTLICFQAVALSVVFMPEGQLQLFYLLSI